MTSRARAARLGLGLALGLAACVKDQPSTDAAGAAPAVSAPSPSAPLASSSPPDAGAPGADAASSKLACRAIAVVAPDGAAGGATFTKLGELLAEEAFLDLPPGARLTAKHPRTTREATVIGPAHARFCVGYEDETWLARGTFQSAPGSGEAPGTESWVVTPFGVARYSSGAVLVTADDVRADVTVTSGAAYLWSGGEVEGERSDAGGDGWQKITAGTVTAGAAAAKDPLDARGAKHAVARCKQAADAARSLAVTMTSSPEGGPPKGLGQLAGAHVAARKEGRAACGVARLRVALLPPSDQRAALLSAVEEASHWAALR